MAELSTGELGLMGAPAVKTCPSVGAACLESLQLLDASPAESPGPSRDPPEPRVATEQTNNRIGESACGGVGGGAGVVKA